MKTSKVPKTEYILSKIEELKEKTGVSRTLFAACPNSMAVIKASLRAAKRNNAPIKFAATLNQVDGDSGYTGMTQRVFTKTIELEARAISYTGPYIIAVDHGGPWLKDIQNTEKWDADRAMNAVKKSFEDAVAAGYDLIHVDPTVDIFLAPGKSIDIKVVVQRTVELIAHTETFRRSLGYPPISYEVGTEEVHGGLADESVFDAFLEGLKTGLIEVGFGDVWPCFIVGKVGTDLHTTLFDKDVAKKLTAKVRPYGSYIKGHYTDGVSNPEDYPLSGMGAANVGPEFTISEYEALMDLEEIEKGLLANGAIAKSSNMKNVLWQQVDESGRWRKWLQPDEKGKHFRELTEERKLWMVGTSCRYIWQNAATLAARHELYENLERNGYNPEEVVLSRIEHDMDKYFVAFNLVNLNNYL